MVISNQCLISHQPLVIDNYSRFTNF